MKKLTTILLLFLSILSYGQSELESTIFKYFNDYRVEHGLNPVKFDDKVFLAADHHNNYLNDNDYPNNYICPSGHLELELFRMSDRLNRFGVDKSRGGGECIAYVFRTIKQNDDSMLKKTISNWDGSPSHKEIMLLVNIDAGAISVLPLVDSVGDYFLVTLNVVNFID
jgi:uncharacterized protein YkwD